MIVHQRTLEIATRGRGFVDVTARDRRRRGRVAASAWACARSSCSTPRRASSSRRTPTRRCSAISARWMERLAPESDGYEHDAEGPDDMPGHLRSAVTRTSEVIPITGGRLALGTWQAIYLWEHRGGPARAAPGGDGDSAVRGAIWREATENWRGYSCILRRRHASETASRLSARLALVALSVRRLRRGRFRLVPDRRATARRATPASSDVCYNLRCVECHYDSRLRRRQGLRHQQHLREPRLGASKEPERLAARRVARRVRQALQGQRLRAAPCVPRSVQVRRR